MDDAALVKEVLDGIDFPRDLKRFDVELADDSSGEPAVWIYLHITRDDHPSAVKIRQLAAVGRVIEEKLMDKHIGRFPYVQVVTD